jgi:geranylgeranyl pyrophosphate synthase
VVETISRYGYEVGMAFQIVDDILDFTGEQETVGKPVASDLRQGLITLPVLCYLDAKPDDPDLKALFNGNNSNGEDRLQRLVSSIRVSGAIDRSMEEARQFVERGLSALEGMPHNRQRKSLEDLALYVVRRHR